MAECVITRVRKGKLLVVGWGCVGLLRKLGLGTRTISGEYLLDVAELAYLIFTGSAAVRDLSGDLIDLESLFRKYSQERSDWVRFSVLLDLRLKGRRAKAGFSPDSLYLSMRDEEVLVFVAEENSLVRASRLHEWVENAVLKGYTPIIALVDASGDVTYYTMRIQRVEDL